MTSKLPHNTLADNAFGEAEKHAGAGRHDEMWHHLNQAQTHAINHAKELAEGGDHDRALSYRKMAVGRLNHISGKLKKSIDDFQMTKYSALAAVWDEMKKQQTGWNRFKYAIPKIELAKTSKEVDELLNLYGIKLNRG